MTSYQTSNLCLCLCFSHFHRFIITSIVPYVCIVSSFSQSCVLEDNMEAHLKKCPLLKQTQTLLVQPYYQQGINRGTDDDSADHPDFTSVLKRNLVYSLTVPQFSDLLSKICSIHNSISKDIGFSYKVPPACHIWINRLISRYVYVFLLLLFQSPMKLISVYS